MAILGYLICVNCKERMCAGKWLRSNNREGFGFWRGGLSNEQSGTKVMHFLARHMNHQILVLTEIFDRPEEYADYRDVEGELDGINPDINRNLQFQIKTLPKCSQPVDHFLNHLIERRRNEVESEFHSNSPLNALCLAFEIVQMRLLRFESESQVPSSNHSIRPSGKCNGTSLVCLPSNTTLSPDWSR
jgi:hypothetical protein